MSFFFFANYYNTCAPARAPRVCVLIPILVCTARIRVSEQHLPKCNLSTLTSAIECAVSCLHFLAEVCVHASAQIPPFDGRYVCVTFYTVRRRTACEGTQKRTQTHKNTHKHTHTHGRRRLRSIGKGVLLLSRCYCASLSVQPYFLVVLPLLIVQVIGTQRALCACTLTWV